MGATTAFALSAEREHRGSPWKGAGWTAERIAAGAPADNYIYQRSYFAYRKACEMVSGRVLEIGTGTGYALHDLAARAELLITVDKRNAMRCKPPANVVFVKTRVPPLIHIPDSSVDHVVSFQVIEHIRDDRAFLNEARRVLRPGGRLILTTPNARTSLSRNPFHVREYGMHEFDNLLRIYFVPEQRLGVFGGPSVERYIAENRRAVARVLRYDVLGLERRLPAWMLRYPYSWLNRWNRQRLAKRTNGSVGEIGPGDLHLADVTDDCLDLFYVLRKP